MGKTIMFSYLFISEACTGIDDLGIAIMHLEEANWVLVVSIRKLYSGQVFHHHISRTQ